MKKIMTYSPEQITDVKTLLDNIAVKGTDNCKYIAMIAQILDAGIMGEVKDEEEGAKDGIPAVLPNHRLEKQSK